LKTETLELEGTTLMDAVKRAKNGHIVFLTKKGQVRFALTPADDFDREVASLRNNAEFMAYLTACEERARTGPLKSLAEIEEKYGINAGKRKPAKKRKTA
jgi:antitoxin (DNA-binding transcriptional repressor) of toxin-antitoxin stability system